MKTFASLLIIAISKFLALLPHRVFLVLVDFLSFVMRVFDRRRYADAKANLDFVFGDTKTQEQKNKIIRRCYRNFAFLILESARVSYMSKSRHLERFSIDGLEYFERTKDKSAIFVSAHFGYWEAIGSALPQFRPEHGMYSLGRLTQFDFINDLIIKSRESFGVKLINKKGAFKNLLKIYSNPKQLVGILVDQNVSESEGLWVKFFDRDVTHTHVASVLSRRFGIEIIPVFIDMNEDYTHFNIKFLEPFVCQNTDNLDEDLLVATQKQALATQSIITQSPQNWFWFHKRFKSKYPDLYS